MRAVTKEGLFCSSESGNLVWNSKKIYNVKDSNVKNSLLNGRFGISNHVKYVSQQGNKFSFGTCYLHLLLRHRMPMIILIERIFALFRIYNSFNLFHQNISKASYFQAKFDYLPHCLAEILLHQANVMHVVTCCCL